MQCVTLSGCGHYAVLGMSSGHVEVFNVQSGIHRGELGRPKGKYALLCHTSTKFGSHVNVASISSVIHTL